MKTDLIAEALRKILPPKHVLTAADLPEEEFLLFGMDRTRFRKPEFKVLCFPESTAEIQKIILFCRKNKLKVTTAGGRTGYSGGATANSDIVIALDKMNRLIRKDPWIPSMTVQAGMITANVQKLARDQNLYFPVDFASAGSSQIGGNVATNAGGIRVIRYGHMRRHVLGLEVVTGKGDIMRFNDRILKNNTGYDLKEIFIGSEGTLGIITEVTLRLDQLPGPTVIAMSSHKDFAAVLHLLAELRREGLPLNAFEFFDQDCMHIVSNHLKLRKTEESSFWTIIELETTADRLFEFLERAAEKGIIENTIPAEAESEKQNLWKYREGISEAIGMIYLPHKNDLSIPSDRMEEFLKRVKKYLVESGKDYQPLFFGHLADGNVHLNVVTDKSTGIESFYKDMKELDLRIYDLVSKLEGSISAEHGIGYLKRDYLHFSRSAEEIAAMTEIKKVFDPDGILNPGKVLP